MQISSDTIAEKHQRTNTTAQISSPQNSPIQHTFDVPGLCQIATIAEIETQGWSLNPGRYVGVDEQTTDDFNFVERFTQLNEELAVLNAEAHQLEERITENVAKILEDTV